MKIENSKKTAEVVSPVKRLVIWCILNGTMAVFLLLGLFNNINWMFNVVKFAVWANFIMWVLILIPGEKSWRAIRNNGFSVGPYANGAYGILFSGVLAATGHFGYAAMSIAVIIVENTIHFSDKIFDR